MHSRPIVHPRFLTKAAAVGLLLPQTAFHYTFIGGVSEFLRLAVSVSLSQFLTLFLLLSLSQFLALFLLLSLSKFLVLLLLLSLSPSLSSLVLSLSVLISRSMCPFSPFYDFLFGFVALSLPFLSSPLILLSL